MDHSGTVIPIQTVSPLSSVVQTGQSPVDIHNSCARLDESFFANLRKLHRIRQFGMQARKRNDLALGALLRDMLGWSKQKPKDERDAIAGRVQELIALGEKLLKWQERLAKKPHSKAKRPEGTEAQDFKEWGDVIMASLRGRLPMVSVEEDAEAKMEMLAAELPVADWWRENVFKGSNISLAVIIAETGDLSNYSTVSKVWKRMGVAVMNGVRQGGLLKTAPKADWIEHGYVRRRRSLLYVIGDVLIKQNEHYRAIYLAEKERQRAKAEGAGLKVVPSAQIPKARAAEFMSDGHVHNRSRRYMEKVLLTDLWLAWRRAKRTVKSEPALPAAESNASQEAARGHCSHDIHLPVASRSSSDTANEAERRAMVDLKSRVHLPAADISPDGEGSAATCVMNPRNSLPPPDKIPRKRSARP